MATVYSALSNGGTLYEPRVGKAWIGRERQAAARSSRRSQASCRCRRRPCATSTGALQEMAKTGTAAWKFSGFPLDKIPIHAKTGTAEVYGKQTTSWFATYTEDYAVVMMISQAGTGSGASGAAVRKIYEALYSIKPTPPAEQPAAKTRRPTESTPSRPAVS